MLVRSHKGNSDIRKTEDSDMVKAFLEEELELSDLFISDLLGV